jgi:hypothetical protein
MNKKIGKIVIGIVVLLVVVCGVVLAVNYGISSNMEKSKIEASSENEIKYSDENTTEFGKIIMANNGKLYYDTRKESTITAGCGMMDGQITSNIDSNEIPTIKNQANFEGQYGYQYGIEENTIEIFMDNKWYVFKAKDEQTTELTLDKVSMTIKEETLTKTGATVIIKDGNENPYCYGAWFRIDKNENGEWKELDALAVVDWKEMDYKVEEDGTLELKENWENIYGEFEKGQYRLVKRIYEDGYKYFYAEFNID